MRYLKNQFRGRIGRTILEKKRQKSSPFYFSTPLKPSVYAVFGTLLLCCNRENNVTLSSVVQKPSILAFFGTGNYLHVLSFSEHQKSLYGRGGIP